jgi:hypothetical protein
MLQEAFRKVGVDREKKLPVVGNSHSWRALRKRMFSHIPPK